MKTYKKLLLILLFSLSTIVLVAQQSVPGRVLFIGNSYTYFWNLPQTVQAMAASTSVSLTTRQSTAGGAHWGHHWRSERGLKTLEILENTEYDAIVLQNHSMSTLNRVDSMFYFGNMIQEIANRKGAQIYLYLTWAREWDPYMQATITEGYTKLADKIGAKIVPVGLAWERARQLRPGLPLYDPDGSHPSPLGTYLSACVFYGVLSGESPIGLSQRLISEDKDGEKIYLNIQTAEDALFCQKVAEEVISSLNK